MRAGFQTAGDGGGDGVARGGGGGAGSFGCPGRGLAGRNSAGATCVMPARLTRHGPRAAPRRLSRACARWVDGCVFSWVQLNWAFECRQGSKAGRHRRKLQKLKITRCMCRAPRTPLHTPRRHWLQQRATSLRGRGLFPPQWPVLTQFFVWRICTADLYAGRLRGALSASGAPAAAAVEKDYVSDGVHATRAEFCGVLQSHVVNFPPPPPNTSPALADVPYLLSGWTRRNRRIAPTPAEGIL